MIKEKTIKTNFGNIAYLETTNGSKQFIYIHGGFGQPAFIGPLEDYFSSKGYKVIAPYLPGHGNSFALPKKFSYSFLLNSMIEFLDNIRAQDIVLLGHSLGGRIAYDLSRARTNKIKFLILSTPLLNRVNQKTLHMSLNLFIDYFIKHRLYHFFAIKSKNAKGKQFRVLGPNLWRINAFWKMIKEIKPIVRDSINIPTLVLWGKQDRMLPFSSQKRFIEFIENKKIHMLSGSHYSYLRRPELTLKIIEQFITSQ